MNGHTKQLTCDNVWFLCDDQVSCVMLVPERGSTSQKYDRRMIAASCLDEMFVHCVLTSLGLSLCAFLIHPSCGFFPALHVQCLTRFGCISVKSSSRILRQGCSLQKPPGKQHHQWPPTEMHGFRLSLRFVPRCVVAL